jgi:CARDB
MHSKSTTIDSRWRKKLYLQLCIFILLATASLVGTNTAYAEVCEKPVCKRGETYKDGYCHSQSGFPTFAKSHYRARCESGWELIRRRGICQKCPPRLIRPTPIRPIPIGPIKPVPRLRRPDLVIRSFGLRSWGRCKVGYPIATFQITVANIGNAASPTLPPTRPLVHIYDQHGAGINYGVPLASIAPGRSRTVWVSLPYKSATAAHIKRRAPHPIRAVVDNIRAIPELNETNNRSANVINMGLPKGCK